MRLTNHWSLATGLKILIKGLRSIKCRDSLASYIIGIPFDNTIDGYSLFLRNIEISHYNGK